MDIEIISEKDYPDMVCFDCGCDATYDKKGKYYYVSGWCQDHDPSIKR